jgi:hypothetical protein
MGFVLAIGPDTRGAVQSPLANGAFCRYSDVAIDGDRRAQRMRRVITTARRRSRSFGPCVFANLPI